MNLSKLFLYLAISSLFGCAEIIQKPHRVNPKTTREISKSAGFYSIMAVKGNTQEMSRVLNNDVMKCNATTFTVPRGNSVGSFIREIFEQELSVANKLSTDGTAIGVVVKSMELENTNAENGAWVIDIDYIQNGKTTNVKNIIEFESKVSVLSSCVNTANVFEEALADNLVDFFKKKAELQ